MARIVIHARLQAAPGRRADVAAAMAPLFDQASTEPGTEVFAMHEARDDPDVLVFYEVYRDADALAAHQAGPAVRAAVGALDGLLARPPDITYLTPARALGLDLD